MHDSINYGEQVNYLGKFTNKEGQTLAWTPLYWNDNIDEVLKYIDYQGEENLSKIQEITNRIKDHPGVPMENIINSKNKDLIESGIHFGYFPSVQIVTPKNRYDYVFTPRAKFDSGLGVFEKAELIVSCIRHGQYHADVTKIRFPKYILNALRTNTLKPHSHGLTQYFPLRTHGVVKIHEVPMWYGKGYKTEWIDTPENNYAADIAEELLSANVPVAVSTEDVEVRQLALDGFFKYTSEQRQIVKTPSILAKNEFERLIQETVGIRE